jgi:hypothetical protein
MPNKTPRDKRGKPPMRTRARPKSKAVHPVHSVGDLLKRSTFSLTKVKDQASRQLFWGTWLPQHLPAPLPGKICAVTENEGTLAIFAESAAWSARLRFAVAELEAEIRAAGPHITTISVRVMPGR